VSSDDGHRTAERRVLIADGDIYQKRYRLAAVICREAAE